MGVLCVHRFKNNFVSFSRAYLGLIERYLDRDEDMARNSFIINGRETGRFERQTFSSGK